MATQALPTLRYSSRSISRTHFYFTSFPITMQRYTRPNSWDKADNWFSNFLPYENGPLVLWGLEFLYPENAFQAYKNNSPDYRRYCATVTPYLSKQAGRQVVLRPDWEDIKFGVMAHVVRHKFLPGTSLHDRLMATSGPIIEWNNWGDRTWGADIKTGHGNNLLGLILMQIREEYRPRTSYVAQQEEVQLPLIVVP